MQQLVSVKSWQYDAISRHLKIFMRMVQGPYTILYLYLSMTIYYVRPIKPLSFTSILNLTYTLIDYRFYKPALVYTM